MNTLRKSTEGYKWIEGCWFRSREFPPFPLRSFSPRAFEKGPSLPSPQHSSFFVKAISRTLCGDSWFFFDDFSPRNI